MAEPMTPEKLAKLAQLRGSQILVRPEPLLQQKMIGALHLPDSVMTEQKFMSPFRVGVVLVVGPGALMPNEKIKRFNMDSVVGDRVLYHNRMENQKLFINGESMLLMEDGHVHLTLSEDAEVVQQVVKPAGVPG